MTNILHNGGGESLEVTHSENGDSTSSELERLDDNSPCPSDANSPTERGLAKTKKLEDAILNTIEQAAALGSNTIDLSNKKMRQFPSEIFDMPQLEYLYLESNELSTIPDELFDKLPNLKWLDLRRNYLVRLPSIYTGRHQNLRNLLLEGNNLRTLPLELGLIKSLHGLNISNNPLEFPPVSVIEKGTTEILKFLREMIQAKSTGKLLSSGKDDEESSSSDDDDWDEDGGDLRQYALRQLQQRSLSTEAARKEEEIRPMNKSAELHRPVTFTEMKKSKVEKLLKAGATGKVEKPKKPSTANSVLNWKVNQFPEPPGQEYVDFKMREERQLAKVKELQEKTEVILQRRKNEDVLKGWRDETKRLKQKKYFESLKKGTKDFLDPVTQAPFDIDKDYMKMPSNEERIKQDVKSAHEKLRRAVSPGTKQRMEEEKAQRIYQLEKRIKQHTMSMHERRKLPKGSPQEEMEAARRELEVAEALHRELMSKRKELEYRFRAFNPSTSYSPSNRMRTVKQLK